MSFSFALRFDTTSLKRAEIFNQLEKALEEEEIHFDGEATKVIEHEGWPTIDVSSVRWSGSDLETAGTIHVERLSDVTARTESYWGVSLDCISAPIARRHGRSTAMEVYVSVFRARNGKWTLYYKESSTAGLRRFEDEDAKSELYSLQLALCKAMGFKMSVYDEEDYDVTPDVTLEEIEGRLSIPDRQVKCSMVIHPSLLSLNEIRLAVGERAQKVRLSTSGYVLCPFL